jgi:restriction system protein
MAKQAGSAPEFVRFIGPVIDALRELGGSGRPDEVRGTIAKALNISEEEQARPLPSGVQSRFDNQVHWARFYLVKGGYIDASRHGVWTLTEKARAFGKLSAAQAREIYREVVVQFRGKASTPAGIESPDEQVAPAADAEHALVNYREEVAAKLQALPAGGFERFCQRLLRESGFEGVTITGRSGDGGIDGVGILQVNALVSFKVLFQCKRVTGSVTPSQVRDFRGAMMGWADKGIIITTGSFTSDARKEAVRDGVPPIEWWMGKS